MTKKGFFLQKKTMLAPLWTKLYSHLETNEPESLRATSAATGIPISTIAYHKKRLLRRWFSSGTSYWDTQEGQWFLHCMILSLIYVFVIKGGVGAGRIKEHLEHLRLGEIMAISESSIYKIIKEISEQILRYQQLMEEELTSTSQVELLGLQVVLGVDETWLEDMLLVCQDLMSGYIFLEEASKQRDVTSWWSVLGKKVLTWGFKIRGLVSDRAKALVKLGDSDYLNVFSMPDLFHFVQEINKAVGLKVGKQLERSKKALDKASEELKATSQEAFEELQQVYQSYRQQLEQINKIVNPFNEQDDWTSTAAVEKALTHCFTSIGKIAHELGLTIDIAKASKILHQIPTIAQGVGNWISLTKADLDSLQAAGKITVAEKEWLTKYAIPYCYWQIQLGRTQAKARNRDLRAYYRQRTDKAEQGLKEADLTSSMSYERLEELLAMAHQMAISFQRASSQTEGRNGYLAFVNHSHRGMPQQRLQVLSVVHNYDIRRVDGTTPAQRLFQRPFPDLFEFLCQNVTGFKEPRRGKCKPLNISYLQH